MIGIGITIHVVINNVDVNYANNANNWYVKVLMLIPRNIGFNAIVQ